jgi:hypothetical protein
MSAQLFTSLFQHVDNCRFNRPRSFLLSIAESGRINTSNHLQLGLCLAGPNSYWPRPRALPDNEQMTSGVKRAGCQTYIRAYYVEVQFSFHDPLIAGYASPRISLLLSFGRHHPRPTASPLHWAEEEEKEKEKEAVSKTTDVKSLSVKKTHRQAL